MYNKRSHGNVRSLSLLSKQAVSMSFPCKTVLYSHDDFLQNCSGSHAEQPLSHGNVVTSCWKRHNSFEWALDNDHVAFFKLHVDVLLQHGTIFFAIASDRNAEFCSSEQFRLSNHMNVTCSHMRSHGNTEQCDKTTQFTLWKQCLAAADITHMRSITALVWCSRSPLIFKSP